MNIVSSILTNNPCYKAGAKIKPKGGILHSVGTPQPRAYIFIKNWDKSTYTRACVHAFIDALDGVVYQTLPWNHRGWHCGGNGNNTHFGVEMCEPDCIKYTSGSSFTCSDVERARAMVKRTYESAVKLFAERCKEFGLDPLASGVILSHKEAHSKGIASNHGDPEHLWKGLGLGYTMDGFRRDVKEAMGGAYVKPSVTPSVYLGPSIIDYLNSIGKPSDFASRKRYATEYGIKAYVGTASQNSKLLDLMRSGTVNNTSDTSDPSVEPAKSYDKAYAKTYTVTANDFLSMRIGANTSKRQVARIDKGEKVRCYGYYTKEKDGTIWLLVEHGKNTGFVSKGYLK